MTSVVFQNGFLKGQSSRYASPDTAITGGFDFVLLVSSWDRRCIEITKAKTLQSSYGSLMLFELKDDFGLRVAHDSQLTVFLEAACKNPTYIHGSSTNLEHIWTQLETNLLAARIGVGRPLRVLIDLCACPRYFALTLLATCFMRGLAESVCVFYAEAQYPEEKNDDETKHELFTAGGWTAVCIPGLEGVWEPGRQVFYLVSVGFEGAKTLRLVSRLEPDRVSVLFPNPGVRGDYPQRTREQNEMLFQLFRISDDQIVDAPAGDAIAAWKALCESSVERPNEENVHYICCGTKPHSIALALKAIITRLPAVLYIVPDRHKVVAIEASGVYWRYDIDDMSAIHFQNKLRNPGTCQ